ncbi:MAG: tyrosine--tRNA ligase [Alphaproteobacteria bacterium]|nr:tyrosine--tRNA ligase [Alphaproteobacteria bacterium]
MTAPRSDFIAAIVERGFLHQCTDLDGLDQVVRAGRIGGYIGFDCTADSLHIGSLVQIMMLRWLQKTGHRAIPLMGGGTTKVGDPSGRDETRRMLSADDIAGNMASIKRCCTNFIGFEGANAALMVDNAEWLDDLKYIPLLRDIGRHFSVNRMLTMDSVRLRLEREQPLSFLEFNYMILQAYDFVELARRYDCRLQMGGSDQWGNIVMGVELGRRVADLALFGLTTPLITTASGAKMGKTAQGAVWLNADRLSPYDYYQFWRNTEDADVGRFLRLFTDLPVSEIARLERLGGAEINDAKKVLALETTKLCHGAANAEAAAETARRTFEDGQLGDGLPSLVVAHDRIAQGHPAISFLQESGLVASLGEARRLVRGGGARVNDQAITDEKRLITLQDLNADGVVKLSAGKKRHALLRVQS